MTRARSLAVAASLALALAAQNPAGVEIVVDAPSSAYVQQPVPVTMTVSYDASWLDAHAVALSRQATDVPLHLDVPWLLAAPERAVTLADAETGDVRVAVGDRVVRARRVDGANGRAALSLTLRWLPLAAGESLLAPVVVRYAYATEFREHLLRGREPVDRRDARVAGDAATLAVLPLPKPVPERFFGAVGEFDVTAAVDRTRAHVGDTLRLEVSIRGDGNLSRFARPLPPTLDGFHVDGVASRSRATVRVLQLDVLALRAGVPELPSWPLVVFSPRRHAYVELAVPAVPLSVEPAPAGAELAPRVRELIAADAADRSGAPTWLYQLGFPLLALFGILLFRRGQMRKGRRALQDALHELRLAAAGRDAERTAAAFERVLARTSGGTAFVESMCWPALRARGVPIEQIEQLQDLRARLDAARFGGEAPAAEQVVPAAELVASHAPGG